MEQSVVINRYVISCFLSEFYINRIDNINDSKNTYLYTIEVIKDDEPTKNMVQLPNLCTIKVYTKGIVEELHEGKWVISPVIKLLTLFDKNYYIAARIDILDAKTKEIYSINIKFEKIDYLGQRGVNFEKEVLEIVIIIKSMEKYFDLEQLRVNLLDKYPSVTYSCKNQIKS